MIRTSWLYSKFQNNFLYWVLQKLKNNEPFEVVSNQVSSPTNSLDLAATILEIIPLIFNQNPVIYNYSNEGFCSKYDFALEVKKIINSDTLIGKKTLRNDSVRPKFSALSCKKIHKKFHIPKFHWKESLHVLLTNNDYI